MNVIIISVIHKSGTKLTVRKAAPQPRIVPRGSVLKEAAQVAPAWERDAPGCWWSQTVCLPS